MRLVAVMCLLCVLGCEAKKADAPKPRPAPRKAAKLEVNLAEGAIDIPNPLESESLDESRSFTHKWTNVRLIFPPGWNVRKPEVSSLIASVDLDKAGVLGSVRWGLTSGAGNTDAAMLAEEMKEHREIYGEKMEGPERVQVGEKIGYRVRIQPPLPYGYPNRKAHRVIYFFFVDSIHEAPAQEETTVGEWTTLSDESLAARKWTIYVMSDAEIEDIDGTNEILHSLRWESE